MARTPNWYIVLLMHSYFSTPALRRQAGVGTSSFAMYEGAVAELELEDDASAAVEDFIETLYAVIAINVGEFVMCEGSGLFPIHSCTNHSCVPNAMCVPCVVRTEPC